MKKASELIWKLEALRDGDNPLNRAKLAALRRGMGQPPGAITEATRVVQGMLDEDAPEWVETTLSVIAPLFALHPKAYEGEPYRNMGNHFRDLVDPEADEMPRSVERRFMVLLTSEPDDLPDALRQAVTLLKSKDVAINWQRLCDDVQLWLRPGPEGEAQRHNVRQRWARSFWRVRWPTSVQALADTPSPMDD
jgi:CRISPR system Cascade subunit CasB